MSRLVQQDIVAELIELCDEVMNEIRQQLMYFRASVYKDETAGNVRRKIDQLRFIARIVDDEGMSDSLRDHDAMAIAGAMQVAPGECSFTTRTTQLLQELTQHCDGLRRQLSQRDSRALGATELARTVQNHRRELLAICRHGSRQWAFFQSI